MAADSLEALRGDVVSCRRCPRLVAYRERVARTKVARFRDSAYWGRPVPGFGDSRARVLVVGLPRGPRREPDGSSLHGRPERRLALPRPPPSALREPGDVRVPRRWAPVARCVHHGRRPLRATPEPPDAAGVRAVPVLPRPRGGPPPARARRRGPRRDRVGGGPPDVGGPRARRPPAPASLRPRGRGPPPSPLGPPRILPPEPAEHLHGPPSGGDARRRRPPSPSPRGGPGGPPTCGEG